MVGSPVFRPGLSRRHPEDGACDPFSTWAEEIFFGLLILAKPQQRPGSWP